MNVLFLHTYVGLGKSTFFRLLQKKYPESYEIVSSDKINKEMREAKLRFKPKDVRKKFEQKIKLSKKIVLADKNFPTLKDSKKLTKNTERISTILYAKDSFELPSILLLLNRVLKRTDHETISPDDDIETMRIMLNFVQKSKASSHGKPQKVSHIDIKVNFFKNNISTANISIFKKALNDALKVAGFTRKSKDENKDYVSKLNVLNRLIKENQGILKSLSETYLKTLPELDAEVNSVHKQITAIAKTVKTKAESKSPLYIGYFIENDILISKLQKIKTLTALTDREGSYFVITKAPRDEKTSHVTMAFGERNVKLFVMSQPPTILQFKINGLLRVTDKKVNLQEVLDVEPVGVVPVKVSKMVNPFHITFKTKKGFAKFSGQYLQKFKEKSLKLEHEYIPITKNNIITLDLRVFYSKGRGVPGEIEKITEILPDDTLSIFNTRNAEIKSLIKEIEEKKEELKNLPSLERKEIDEIINKHNLKHKGTLEIKRKRIGNMVKDIIRKKKIIFKEISSNYLLEDEPDFKLFEPFLSKKLSAREKKFIMDLLDSGFNKFMISKRGSTEKMFNTLLTTSKNEIENIKLMSPNNFKYWSTAYFNWLSGLSNADRDRLVKKNIEYGKEGKIFEVGFGFKTETKEAKNDDEIYKNNVQLRSYLPRGIYFDSNKQLKNFAIRKFFGEGLDEDYDEGEDRYEGKDKFKYIFKGKATHFFATDKANGENAQIHVDDSHIYVGSKNRKIKLEIIKWKSDLEEYKKNFRKVKNGVVNYDLYSYSIPFAENLLNKLEEKKTFNSFITFLQLTKWTGNFEYENIDSQHIVYLHENRSVLIGFSSPFMDGLTCHPFLSVLIGISCNLAVVGEKGILERIPRMNSYINKMRQEEKSEGDVIVELSSDGKALSLVKKKTYWYIILRAAREQIRKFLPEIKKDNSDLKKAKKEVEKRVNSRLDILFNKPFLKGADNIKKAKKDEMSKFSKFVVEKYFNSNKPNVELFLGKYPVFYNEFLNLGSPSSTDEKKKDYSSKYLKYKQKYLTLKKLLDN